jgi:GTP-binding protein Era
MVNQALSVLGDADLLLLLVECFKGREIRETLSGYPGPGVRSIVERISRAGTPSILVINKIDLLENRALLLPQIDRLKEAHDFEEIVPVSAATGDGVDLLVSLLVDRMPEGPRYFPEGTLTDQAERFLAAEFIREQAFAALKQELPYAVAVEVEAFEERPESGFLHIAAAIVVERDSQKGIIIGKKAERLKRIGSRARSRIELFLGARVFLDLRVRVAEGWSRDAAMLRRLGYQE